MEVRRSASPFACTPTCTLLQGALAYDENPRLTFGGGSPRERDEHTPDLLRSKDETNLLRPFHPISPSLAHCHCCLTAFTNYFCSKNENLEQISKAYRCSLWRLEIVEFDQLGLSCCERSLSAGNDVFTHRRCPYILLDQCNSCVLLNAQLQHVFVTKPVLDFPFRCPASSWHNIILVWVILQALPTVWALVRAAVGRPRGFLEPVIRFAIIAHTTSLVQIFAKKNVGRSIRSLNHMEVTK